jgi:hypothetical protein
VRKKTIKLLEDEEVRKRFAKLMVRDCFRNTILEDYHAGKELPKKYKEYSRITDLEMRFLMREAVDNMYLYLSAVIDGKMIDEVLGYLKENDPLSFWDEPKIPKAVIFKKK